ARGGSAREPASLSGIGGAQVGRGERSREPLLAGFAFVGEPDPGVSEQPAVAFESCAVKSSRLLAIPDDHGASREAHDLALSPSVGRRIAQARLTPDPERWPHPKLRQVIREEPVTVTTVTARNRAWRFAFRTRALFFFRA